MALAGRQLPRAPEAFEGTVAELVDGLALALSPDPAVAARFHARLLAHLEGEDPVHLVRKVGRLRRGHEVRTEAGARLLAGDEAPAWWLHALVHHEVLPEGPLEPWLAALPTHRDQTHGVPHLHQARWQLAHLAPVDDGDTRWRRWDRAEAAARTLRALHPCNHLALPLVDWQASGGLPEVLAYAAWRYRRRYRRTWFAFAEGCGGELPRPSERAGRRPLLLAPAAAPAPDTPARTLEAVHLVCKEDQHLRELGEGRFETGPWSVDPAHCDELRFLALHRRKAALSHRQGRVLSWRTVPHEGRDRVVFTVEEEGEPVTWRGGSSGERGYVWSDGRNGDGSR